MFHRSFTFWSVTMTPLRQRVLDDMRMRNLSPNTQDAYLRAIAAFAQHFGRSPDRLDATHVREYLLLIIRRKKSWQRPVMIATHATEMLDEDILDDNKPLTDSPINLVDHTRVFVPKI